jgi:hypothetical protein
MIEITDLEAIESLGHLLAHYRSDLEYIGQFNLFMNNQITVDQYLMEGNSSFQKFIKEFKVARNIKKEKKKDLLDFIKDSLLPQVTWTVDAFAEEMKKKKLTSKDDVMTVLASKIFFLSQPNKIIPMDSFNKRALGLRANRYEDFEMKINEFVNEIGQVLSTCLDNVRDYLSRIERSVNIQMDFKRYRMNRFTDKYLWVKGRRL